MMYLKSSMSGISPFCAVHGWLVLCICANLSALEEDVGVT
jgi:hypothetical protein